MIENFGGVVNFSIFLILTFGWAMYGYQMSIGIKAFYDKFGISHTGIIIGGFVASFSLAAVLMHVIMLLKGPEGAWHLFLYFIIQAILAAILSFRTVQAKVAVDEGVRYTPEPVVAPIIFGCAYSFLLYNMQGVLFV